MKNRILGGIGAVWDGLSLGLILLSGAVHAQNAVATQDQGQARQLGILVGGTATQYDLCVKRGFVSKSDPSAEEIARLFFDKMRAAGGPDQTSYAQEGWEMMKKEIAAHEAFYTQEKCVGVGKEWAKITATMRKK